MSDQQNKIPEPIKPVCIYEPQARRVTENVITPVEPTAELKPDIRRYDNAIDDEDWIDADIDDIDE